MGSARSVLAGSTQRTCSACATGAIRRRRRWRTAASVALVHLDNRCLVRVRCSIERSVWAVGWGTPLEYLRETADVGVPRALPRVSTEKSRKVLKRA